MMCAGNFGERTPSPQRRSAERRGRGMRRRGSGEAPPDLTRAIERELACSCELSHPGYGKGCPTD
jgi:hypothetical protein